MSLAGVTISGVSASWASGSPFVFAGTISIGGSSLAVSGSYTNTSTWTFSANGSTSIFGTTVAASGSIVSTSGTVSGSYTMSLNNFTVATGMTINSLVMSWSPSGGLTGSGALVLGGTTLNLSGAYTDSSNWSFDASGSLSLFGATVTATGTVTKSSGSISGCYSMAMGDISVVTGMTVNGLTMRWCQGQGLTGSGALVIGGTTLNLSGSYTNISNWAFNANGSLTLFGVSVVATGSYVKSAGVTSGSYSMAMGNIAVVAGMTVNGLTMTWTPGQGLTGVGALVLGGTTLNLSGSYSNNSNWAFTAAGSLSLFGQSVTASGTYTKSGGTTSGSYSMPLNPFSAVPGMSLSNMVMSWTPGQGLTGIGSLSLGGTSLSVNDTYSDSNNWSFTAGGSLSLFGTSFSVLGSF